MSAVAETHEPRRFLSIKEVLQRVPLSKPTIYRKIGQNEFPKPVPFGKRVSRWIESEIDDWIAQRVEARDV